MSDWVSHFQSHLVEGEKLLGVVDSLHLYLLDANDTGFGWETVEQKGAIALTNFRLIATWQQKLNDNYWEQFSAVSVNGLYKISDVREKSKQPSCFIVLLGTGVRLAVSTRNRDPEQEKRLSAFLVQALMHLKSRQADDVKPPRRD